MGTDVTVVVTCYNQAAFVAEAISSVVRQTHPCEIIVVDDGSTDGSPDLAEKMGMRVVRRPHRGALATFRAGVDLVQTEFYCLLNADDVLEPEYLARTRSQADDPRVGFVYTGWRYIGTASGTERARPFDARSLLFGNYVHAASLTRKAAYDDVGGFDPAFADHFEDWALWVAMVHAGWRGVPVPDPLLRYRRHHEPSRNPTSIRAFQSARLRLAKRYPRMYGAVGFGRLAGSAMRWAARSAYARTVGALMEARP